MKCPINNKKGPKIMSVFTRGPYGRLAVVLNTLSSINIEIIIIIIIIIILVYIGYLLF